MISDRMRQADAQQQSYPALSKIYGQLSETPIRHRFQHLYCGTQGTEQTAEYQVLFHKYIQLKKDYKALQQELSLYKEDYVNEMIKNSRL